MRVDAAYPLLSCAGGQLGDGEEEPPHVFGRNRVRDIVTLNFGTAFGPHAVKLLPGLDAFGGGYHTQTGSQVHQGAHEGDSIAVCGREIADEALVYLHLVEGELPEVAHRRITSAKIIESYFDPQLAKLLECRECPIGIVENNRLCDLKFKPLCLEPRLRERAHNSLHQRAAFELGR